MSNTVIALMEAYKKATTAEDRRLCIAKMEKHISNVLDSKADKWIYGSKEAEAEYFEAMWERDSSNFDQVLKDRVLYWHKLNRRK